MPTYRYRCRECGEDFELWQSIKDDPIRTHDDGCGGEVVKVLTPAGIVLKGSGFYKNDSRSAGPKRSGDGSTSKSDGGDASSSDAKPSQDSGSKESGSKGSGSKESGSTPAKESSKPSSGDSKSTAGAAKPT